MLSQPLPAAGGGARHFDGIPDIPLRKLAQQMRPDSFVLMAGYGECAAPGYIPTEKAVEERDTNLRDWCWVAPGSEKRMRAALAADLKQR